MSCCTFFGDHDCSDDVVPVLRKVIEDLVVKCGVDEFFVGDSGNFDRLVYVTLQEVENILYDYPIRINKVLACLPEDMEEFIRNKYLICPLEMDLVPKRNAVLHRNNYMINESKYVVTYTVRSEGEAVKLSNKARKRGRKIIDLAELMGRKA